VFHENDKIHYHVGVNAKVIPAPGGGRVQATLLASQFFYAPALVQHFHD
jgi:hypothetical protein